MLHHCLYYYSSEMVCASCFSSSSLWSSLHSQKEKKEKGQTQEKTKTLHGFAYRAKFLTISSVIYVIPLQLLDSCVKYFKYVVLLATGSTPRIKIEINM